MERFDFKVLISVRFRNYFKTEPNRAMPITTRPQPTDIQLSFLKACTIELTLEKNDVKRYVKDAKFDKAGSRSVVQKSANNIHGQAVSEIVNSTSKCNTYPKVFYTGEYYIQPFAGKVSCGVFCWFRNPAGVEQTIW